MDLQQRQLRETSAEDLLRERREIVKLLESLDRIDTPGPASLDLWLVSCHSCEALLERIDAELAKRPAMTVAAAREVTRG